MLASCCPMLMVTCPSFLLPPELGQDGGREWRFEVYLMRSMILQCSLASPNEHHVSLPTHHHLALMLRLLVPCLLLGGTHL